jgi:hypothetical protein
MHPRNPKKNDGGTFDSSKAPDLYLPRDYFFSIPRFQKKKSGTLPAPLF